MGRKCFRVLIFKCVYWVLSWRVSRCFKINSFLLFPVQILSFNCTCFSPCEGGHGAGHRRAEPGLCTTTCRHHAREHRLRGRHHTQATGHIGLLLLLREAAAYQFFFFNWRDYPLVARRLFIYQPDCKVRKILSK